MRACATTRSAGELGAAGFAPVVRDELSQRGHLFRRPALATSAMMNARASAPDARRANGSATGAARAAAGAAEAAIEIGAAVTTPLAPLSAMRACRHVMPLHTLPATGELPLLRTADFSRTSRHGTCFLS